MRWQRRIWKASCNKPRHATHTHPIVQRNRWAANTAAIVRSCRPLCQAGHTVSQGNRHSPHKPWTKPRESRTKSLLARWPTLCRALSPHWRQSVAKQEKQLRKWPMAILICLPPRQNHAFVPILKTQRHRENAVFGVLGYRGSANKLFIIGSLPTSHLFVGDVL